MKTENKMDIGNDLKRKRLIAIALGAILLVSTLSLAAGLIAGTNGSGSTISAKSAVTTDTSASPELLVLTPNGTIFTGGQPIAISFATINFNLTAPEGQPNEPGYGHVHVYVDGQYYELIDQVQTIYLWLPAGMYNVSLQLVNNNHTPLSPNVEVNLTYGITMAPSTATPSIVILNPGSGASFNGVATISFAVFNFYVGEPDGQANAPNEGHVHVLVNGNYYELVSTVNPIELYLNPGTYNITLLLVNNNHSPYLVNGKEISATITITINSTSSAVNPGSVSSAQGKDIEYLAIGAVVLSLVAAIGASVAAVRIRRK